MRVLCNVGKCRPASHSEDCRRSTFDVLLDTILNRKEVTHWGTNGDGFVYVVTHICTLFAHINYLHSGWWRKIWPLSLLLSGKELISPIETTICWSTWMGFVMAAENIVRVSIMRAFSIYYLPIKMFGKTQGIILFHFHVCPLIEICVTYHSNMNKILSVERLGVKHQPQPACTCFDLSWMHMEDRCFQCYLVKSCCFSH